MFSILAIAEAVSLWLTVLVLYGCYKVSKEWGKVLPKSIKGFINSSYPKSVKWLALGVVVSFAGQFWDNLYWGVAWTLDYIGHPAKDIAFQHGVYSNIPFRQMAGGFSAFCHLLAVLHFTDELHSDEEMSLRNVFLQIFASVVAASIALVILTWIRNA